MRVRRGILHEFHDDGESPVRVLLMDCPARLGECWERVGIRVSDPTTPPQPELDAMERVPALSPQCHVEIRP